MMDRDRARRRRRRSRAERARGDPRAHSTRSASVLPRLVQLYDDTASLQDRTVQHRRRCAPTLARQFGAGGFVGRASGRDFDARRDLAYAPYDELDFEVPLLDGRAMSTRGSGFASARSSRASHLLDQILARLPGGPIAR